jgi:hypothetical protein
VKQRAVAILDAAEVQHDAAIAAIVDGGRPLVVDHGQEMFDQFSGRRPGPADPKRRVVSPQ